MGPTVMPRIGNSPVVSAAGAALTAGGALDAGADNAVSATVSSDATAPRAPNLGIGLLEAMVERFEQAIVDVPDARRHHVGAGLIELLFWVGVRDREAPKPGAFG